MSSDTSVLALEDCLDALIDYRGKTPAKTASGIPLVTAKIIKGGRIETPTEFISSEEYETWMRRGIPKPGDVVLTTEAPLGEVAQLGSDKVALAQRVITLRGKAGLLDSTYLLYLLQTEEMQEQLKARATGTTVQGIKQSELRKVTVALLPYAEQVEAAAILSALDKRIALLRETNATLEAIAQALFKSWFVDFDPVRAKAEGREPDGLDADTAALFPGRFEESELGLVPRGWTVSTLFEHIRAERGLSYKGAGLCSANEGRPMHNLNSVYEGGGYKYPGIKFYSGDFKERHVAHAGDIIVTNTEQGHQHRLIGFPAIVPERYDTGIFSHHLYRLTIRPQSPLTPQVVYYLLMSPAVREQVIGCANGSTVNMLKIEGMEIPRFVCAPAPVARAFEDMTVSIRKQAELNVTRAESLAEVRDTLLPRLISGQLRIPEAEAMLEDAA